MKVTYFTAVLLVQIFAVSCQFTPILDSSTEAFVDKILEHWQSPTGFGLAVVRRDAAGTWHVETGGYGRATLDGSRNVTGNTIFGIGSNTKTFTALAIGLLTHDTRVSPSLTWTSRMRDVLSGWGLVDNFASEEATIQDLLSHRTGVPRHDAAVRKKDTDADIIRKVRNLRPSAGFRDVWQYSNNMYKVLATLPAALLPSRQPLARYVKENIFDKLGLNSTTYFYAVAKSSGELAEGIGGDVSGGQITPHVLPFWNSDSGEDGNNESGDGGITSSAADLAVFIQALLLNGANPKTNETVIPADVVQRLATGYSVMYGAARYPELSPIVYGGGQERGSYRGHEFIEHTGAVPGYNSVIVRYPDSNSGIVVLSNDNELGSVTIRIMQYYLADRIFGLDPVDWDSRYQAIYFAPGDGSVPTPRPANATFPYGDVKRLEGVFDNAGYGKVEFCYTSITSAIQGASKTCNDLRAQVSTILPDILHPGVPTFVAEWDAYLVSHLVLKHHHGGVFNLSAVQNYPTGNASSPYWVQDLGISALAEVTPDLAGMAWIGGAWGAAPGVPDPSGNTLKERAEVWFTRT